LDGYDWVAQNDKTNINKIGNSGHAERGHEAGEGAEGGLRSYPKNVVRYASWGYQIGYAAPWV
jgi:hypothetical protein